MALLELDIQKKLKSFTLEVGLSLKEQEGQVLVLFGPSGSGKTLTLKCIAGVIEPDTGYISIAGVPVFDSQSGTNLKLQKRRVGYLPQNYGLFPHLKVTENISFGLFQWDREKAAERVRGLVKLMQLEGLENHFPRQLSGGQQQRVGLARALAPRPSILLLDEPFSALDGPTRGELRENLAALSRELNLPLVFITHDLEEAFILADRIAVYHTGKILQLGSREDVYYRPASPVVARLIGIRNLWEGRVLGWENDQKLVKVRTTTFDLWVELPPGKPPPRKDERLFVCIRPELVSLSPVKEVKELGKASSGEFQNYFQGKVINEIGRGSLSTLFFKLGEEQEESGLSGAPLSSHDLELEISARGFLDFKLSPSGRGQIEIKPSAVHLIY